MGPIIRTKEVVHREVFTNRNTALMAIEEARKNGWPVNAYEGEWPDEYVVETKRREVIPTPTVPFWEIKEMAAVHELEISKPDCWL